MIDFLDPLFLSDPYPTLNAVREQTAIFVQAKEPNGSEMWFLTRHEDVQRALLDRRLGRSYDHALTHEEAGMSAPAPHLKPFTDLERWSLLQLEPPEHTRIRSLLAHVFTPRRVTDLAPRMVTIVDDLLDNADPNDFELLSDLAQPFSLLVMCELLGAPFSDRERLLGWSHDMVKMYELSTSVGEVEAAVQASSEFAEWASVLIAKRRADPADDLVSALCFAGDGQERLSNDEIVSTIVLLLNAGHEATVNTLGNGIVALLKHPDEWARLVGGEVDHQAAPEELFRYDSPLQLFERWVLADDYVVADQPIAKGDKIAMLFGSANRDPRKWDRPDDLDIGRADRTHVTFGRGVHHCVGAPLARLEVATTLERLVSRFPGTTLTDDPVRHKAFVIHGYESVQLRLR